MAKRRRFTAEFKARVVEVLAEGSPVRHCKLVSVLMGRMTYTDPRTQFVPAVHGFFALRVWIFRVKTLYFSP